MIDLRHGDCLNVMRGMDDASVTAIVTDPPYALSFMGKGWDQVLPPVDVWCEALRVLKPGGVLLAFGGTRTFHRLACSIEDAGFHVRDCLCWLYGSGFPKSMAIDKAIDRADGAERAETGRVLSTTGNRKTGSNALAKSGLGAVDVGPQQHRETLPASSRSRPWGGYGTALKPAWEPIIIAMKPTDGTFAANALAHGVAGINVDGCRIQADDKAKFPDGVVSETEKVFGQGRGRYSSRPRGADSCPSGRWPTNVVLDESAAEAVGAPARFFYCAKASKNDRGDGNNHPTVKPTELMRWLVRMVKMPSGTTVLDPFMGSGSTGVACKLEGVDFVGIEREADYMEIARRRIET